jgi:hypothetical protein
LTRHHIKTRKVDKHDIELICRDCHKTIHAFFANNTVAKELNSVDALLANADFAKALMFIRKQPAGSSVRVRQARTNRRRR